MDAIDFLIQRTAERLEELGLTERAASLSATGSPDAIRYIRTRRAMPNPVRLHDLARTLLVTPQWLLGKSEEKAIDLAATYANNGSNIGKPSGDAGSSLPPGRELPSGKRRETDDWSRGADVSVFASARSDPVSLSTAALSGSDEDTVQVQAIEIARPRVIGHFRDAPVRWISAATDFGFYMPVLALAPVIENGAPAIASIVRPIRERDYALFYLRNEGGDGWTGPVIPARVVAIEAEHYVAQQLSGPSFIIAPSLIQQIHRIYTMSDLLRQ